MSDAAIPFVEDLERKLAERAEKHRRAVEAQVARTDALLAALDAFVRERRPVDSSRWTGR